MQISTQLNSTQKDNHKLRKKNVAIDKRCILEKKFQKLTNSKVPKPYSKNGWITQIYPNYI